MELNKIPKSELELLSYTEIAKMYLKENKSTKNTADLFKEVCRLLELSEEEEIDIIDDDSYIDDDTDDDLADLTIVEDEELEE